MTPRLSIALNSPYFLSQSLAFIRISKDLSDSGPVILHASLATACPIAVLRDLTRIKLLTYMSLFLFSAFQTITITLLITLLSATTSVAIYRKGN